MFDYMIKEHEIQKSLETDNLIFMEGHLKKENPLFIDHEEVLQDI